MYMGGVCVCECVCVPSLGGGVSDCVLVPHADPPHTPLATRRQTTHTQTHTDNSPTSQQPGPSSLSHSINHTSFSHSSLPCCCLENHHQMGPAEVGLCHLRPYRVDINKYLVLTSQQMGIYCAHSGISQQIYQTYSHKAVFVLFP